MDAVTKQLVQLQNNPGLNRTRAYDCNPESTKTLVHAFVTSHLDYCNSLLFGVPKYQIDRLQKVLNAAARLIFSLITFRPPYFIFTGFLWLIAFILSCYF